MEDGLAMAPGLYVVGTPIGHLSDLGRRAEEILRKVDVVAAEDTRVSRVLLSHIGSSARLISARAHNEAQAAQTIIELIAQGRSVALISDAGTPAISDPGARVVAAVRAAGQSVTPVPGPSALVTLLSAAGLAPAPILFEGFLPSRGKARLERLGTLAQACRLSGSALVLYEAPHRIAALLAELARVFGARHAVVIGRELTKRHEEIAVMELAAAPAWLGERPGRERGEFVVAVAPPPAGADRLGTKLATEDTAGDNDGADGHAGALAPENDPATRRLLSLLLAELPPARAARLAHAISGQPREAIYALAMRLKAADD